jgi:hypothetical protein
MPYPPSIASLVTESDGEQKLLLPLLAEAHLLGCHLREVKTKE